MARILELPVDYTKLTQSQRREAVSALNALLGGRYD